VSFRIGCGDRAEEMPDFPRHDPRPVRSLGAGSRDPRKFRGDQLDLDEPNGPAPFFTEVA